MKGQPFKTIIIIFFLIICIIGYSQDLTAGEDEKKFKKDKKDQKLIINAIIYMEYAHLNGWQNNNYSRISRWGRPSSVQSKNHNDTFRIQRMYLNFNKNLGDIFSVRITTDIDVHSSSKGPNTLFLKYAYLQGKHTFSTDKYPVTIRGQFGKISTPNVNLILKRSDLRWIDGDFLFYNGKRLLDGFANDWSADFGANAEIEIIKRVSYSFAITNGEGYKNQNKEILAQTKFDGKAFYHLVSVFPLKRWLYLNFHYRDEIAEKHNPSDDDILSAYIDGESFEIGSIRTRYWGVSAIWDMDFLKAGGGVLFPEKRTGRRFNTTGMITNPVYHQEYILGYAWLHFNLAPLVKPAPLIVIGQFAYGRKFGRLAAYTGTGGYADKTTMLFGAGIGWQFNRNVRIAAYWENQSYTVQTPGVVRAGDGIDLSSDPTGELFSGYSTNHFLTRDPVDKNNVYVKVAVEY